MGDRRIVLVTRKTRLEELVQKYNTAGQARFYIEHLGQDFSDYLDEHDNYKRMADRILSSIAGSNKYIHVDRSYLSSFLFDDSDMVYVLGQDGLVANTMKYLKSQPVVAINPDPSRWAGILLPFTCSQALVDPEKLIGTSRERNITLGKVSLNDGQEMLAVNDFYIGQSSHISSRYQIFHRDRSESQSSSGIIVSTGVGSTGWLKSVIAGARGISSALGNGKLSSGEDGAYPWDADYLKFAVREPYASPVSGAGIVFGEVHDDSPLRIVSGMSDRGVIFSDGMEGDYLEFSSGMTASIGIAGHKAKLLQPL